jgi:hypothetical protein
MTYASGVLSNLTTAYQAVALTGHSSVTVWTLVIDTATDATQYGIDLTVPETADITITSDSDATKAEIADALATTWNANATCAFYAAAVSDGVDTVTFTGASNTEYTLVKDESPGKMTLTHAANAAGDAYSTNIPFGVSFAMITLWFNNVIAATEVTWYLSADAAGDYAVTNPFTSELGTNDGSPAWAIESIQPLKMERLASVSKAGRLYLHILADVADGMDLAVGRISW